jgi:hypothetical protein
MKIYTIIVVARQINGEYIFVRSEQAYVDELQATARLQELKLEFTNKDGTVKSVQLSTPQGNAACYCEVGVHEIELIQ